MAGNPALVFQLEKMVDWGGGRRRRRRQSVCVGEEGGREGKGGGETHGDRDIYRHTQSRDEIIYIERESCRFDDVTEVLNLQPLALSENLRKGERARS